MKYLSELENFSRSYAAYALIRAPSDRVVGERRGAYSTGAGRGVSSAGDVREYNISPSSRPIDLVEPDRIVDKGEMFERELEDFSRSYAEDALMGTSSERVVGRRCSAAQLLQSRVAMF